MNPFALTAEERAGAMMAPAREPDVGAFMDNISELRAMIGPSVASRMVQDSQDQINWLEAGNRGPRPLTEDRVWLADDVAGGLLGTIKAVGGVGRLAENLRTTHGEPAMNKLQPPLVPDDHPVAWANNMTIKRDLHRDALVSVPILRRIGDRGSPPTITIEDGQVILTASEFAADDRIRRYIDDWVKPFGDDVFVRSTNSPDDIKHLKKGTHRGSRNHRDDIEEGGLSVARTLEFPAKYQYLVRGKVIGHGTDGEPLLETSSVQPISKPMSASDMQDLQKSKIRERMEAMGLTMEDYRALSSGGLVVRQKP